MYVTGCQICKRPTTSAGLNPKLSVTAGSILETRKAATFATTRALIAGVRGPGPNE